ncbi:alpha/beta fold hydrolase [Desulfobulbus elongatus]|uniref:alpha/beta fold hydrolase n=1 Tax=Desulfobulbus elongatus TaxID=53332 RepID=UPI0004847B8C|nr:alpha/beta hydrolase [Desulfobulbus elongatus]
MDAITEKTIDCGGWTLHCLECGKPDGKAVVLLHGMKFQAATWRELGTLEVLAGLGLRVLAVDMPGFGRSPAGDVQPVKALTRFFDLQGVERAVLIGPSMGGRIALEFAIGHPEKVAGLVLVGAVGVEENRARLAEITVPSLIVWGGEDQVSPLANSEILLAGLQDARREIYPGAPHPCYLAEPERWHASLRTFFTALHA